MGAIEWSSDFISGIVEIDEQHKRIFFYIKELEKISQSGNMIEVRYVINGLVDYTLTHFEFEEELQERAGYPFVKAHKKVHDIFRSRITVFLERLDSGEDIVQDLIFMLKTWIANHIKGDDRDIIEAVRKMLESKKRENADWLSATVRRMFGKQDPGAFRSSDTR